MQAQLYAFLGAVVSTVLFAIIWSWKQERDKNAALKYDLSKLKNLEDSKKMSDAQLTASILDSLHDDTKN